MFDPILTTLNLVIDPIDKLSRLYGDRKLSKRDQLCHALFLLFEHCNEIVSVSDELLECLTENDDEKRQLKIQANHKKLAKTIMSMWRPLISLRHFMEISDPDFAKRMQDALGPKLTMIHLLGTATQSLGRIEERRFLHVLKRLEGANISHRYRDIDFDALHLIAENGEAEIETIDLENPEQLSALVRHGRKNVEGIKGLKCKLRDFMNDNFDKEDFFFYDI